MLSWTQFFDSPADAVLVRHCQTVVDITIYGQGGGASAKQLSMLRKHVGSLRELPIGQLRAKLSQSPSIGIGAFKPDHAEQVKRDLISAGLSVDARTITVEELIAFDTKLNMPVLMVDPPTTNVLVAQMHRNGVPIIEGDSRPS